MKQSACVVKRYDELVESFAVLFIPLQVTSRTEPFLDLSLEVLPNASITSCLRNFSVEERLARQDKFYCDKCCSLQEAQKVSFLFPFLLVCVCADFRYHSACA